MNLLLAQIDPVIQTGEKLAAQSDRVLFLISQVIMVSGFLYAIRYLAKQIDAKDKKIEGIMNESNQAIRDNTEALKALTSKVSVIVCFGLMALAGCSTANTHAVKDHTYGPPAITNGVVVGLLWTNHIHEEVWTRAKAFLDATNDIQKAQSTVTKASVKAGFEDVKQATSGETARDLGEKLIDTGASFVKPKIP